MGCSDACPRIPGKGHPDSELGGTNRRPLDKGRRCEPFVEGTQDEKVFRVMKDRERWFNVVMGAKLELDEWSTDRIAGRVELPEAAAAPLAMDLSV